MSGAPASTPTESQAVDADAPVENVPPTTETVAEPSVEMETPEQVGHDNEKWIATPTARDDVNEEPQPSDNMSDEEFEAFMKKAQAFYDTQAEETPSNENIAEESGDDDDEFPSLEVHSGDD